MAKEDNYLYEDEDNVMKLGYRIKEIVYDGITKCGQHVVIFDSVAFGRTLVIDDMVQSSIDTEFIYNEMMVHMALDCQRNVENVLIIGGGSGLTSREVLKYNDIKNITLCDISDDVINLCETYIPEYVTYLKDDKINVVIEDGSKHIKKYNNELDGIIVDCCDPIGSAECLYTKEFYIDCINALSDNGVLCVQTGSPMFKYGNNYYNNLISALNGLTGVQYKPLIFTCPMIIGGFYMFVLITKDNHINWNSSYHINKDDVKYYSPNIRSSYFEIPNFIKSFLEVK